MRYVVARFVSRHSLATFLFIAYGWSWTVWFPGVLRYRSSLAMAIGAFGPTVAAIVVTALSHGHSGVGALLARLFTWRVGIRWYVAAAVLPYLATAVIVPLYFLRGGSIGPIDHDALARLPVLFAMALPNGPLGEELGWRGFLLPHLSTRMNLLKASLLIGFVWTFWHTPLFYAPFGSFISGLPVTFTSVGLFLTLVTGLSVAMAWVWRHALESVLVTILMHTFVNINAVAVVFPGVARAQFEFLYLSVALLWLFILAIVAIDRHFWRHPTEPVHRDVVGNDRWR
jgi:membrane protease YdiL (CAAX protease family)